MLSVSTAMGLPGATALAMCEEAHPLMAPPGGVSVPPNPVLYWFEPDGWAENTLRANVPVTLGQPEEYGDFTVRRLSVERRRGAFRIQIGEDTFAYRIDSQWTSSGELEAVHHSYSKDAWACSHTDTLNLWLRSDAPVFRVEWNGGSTMLPAEIGTFFAPPLTPAALPVSDEVVVYLGHLSCLGATVLGGLPPPHRDFSITAMYPDGSSRRTHTRVLPPPTEPESRTVPRFPGSYLSANAFGAHEPPNPLLWLALLLVTRFRLPKNA